MHSHSWAAAAAMRARASGLCNDVLYKCKACSYYDREGRVCRPWVLIVRFSSVIDCWVSGSRPWCRRCTTRVCPTARKRSMSWSGVSAASMRWAVISSASPTRRAMTAAPSHTCARAVPSRWWLTSTSTTSSPWRRSSAGRTRSGSIRAISGPAGKSMRSSPRPRTMALPSGSGSTAAPFPKGTIPRLA